MLICYIDESGTPDLPGNTSHYILAGLSVPIHRWKLYEGKIQKIKQQYQLANAEIHTAWLARKYLEQSKVKDFERLNYERRMQEVESLRREELYRLQKKPSQRAHYHTTKKNYIQTRDYIHLTYQERREFLQIVAKTIGSWQDCRLFAECINKEYFDAKRAKKTPDEQAFEQLVSRFEQYLKIYSDSSKDKKFGLLVHDNNETVSRKLTELMKHFHSAGTLWTSVRHIIETPLFVDSQLTSTIQLADICSYALRRYLENNEDYLFNEVYKLADKKSSGQVVGVRHFTTNECECRICSSRRV